MPSELAYQRYLVKAVNFYGGYAIKMSNAYLAGIPDLLIKCAEWDQPQVWEVKKEEYAWVRGGGEPRAIIISTTELQKKTLKDMRKAGIQVGILIILPGPGRRVTLVLTRDLDQDRIQPEEFERCHCVKTLTDNWHQMVLRLNDQNPLWGHSGITQTNRQSILSRRPS